MDIRVGPLINTEERFTSISENKLSYTDNTTYNYSASVNLSETDGSVSTEPFVGMKFISFILPSFFDFLSKFFLFNGLFLLDSEFILRSVIEIILAHLFGKIVMKNSWDKYSFTGSAVIVLGLLVGFIYYQVSKSVPGIFFQNGSSWGVVFCIFGEVLQIIQYLFQSKYFKTGERYFYREVAWEGFFGFIMSFFVLFLTMIYNCPNRGGDIGKNRNLICTEYDLPFRDIVLDIEDNLIWNLIFFITCIFFSSMGVFLIKYNGMIHRAVIDVTRVPFFVFFQLIRNYKGKNVFDFVLAVIFLILICFGSVLATIIKNYKEDEENKTDINQGNNLNDINAQNNL